MGKKVTENLAIVAGGEIQDYAEVAKQIESSVIVCADSGYRHCKILGTTPDLIVGDFDSIENIPEGIDTIRLNPDKNFTDSYHAVKEALAIYEPSNIFLTGMLGSRIDHGLANIALLADLACSQYTVSIIDGKNTIYCLYADPDKKLSSFVFESKENHYFSLTAYSDICENVTIHNGKYPLNSYDLNNREGRAISNEFVGIPIKITFKTGALLFTTYKK